MIRLARITVAAVVSAVAIAWLLVACIERPTSSDAGADPDISACCDWFFAPWLSAPGDCLCDHTARGEQRWLTCLGGVVEYRCDRRDEP